MTSMNVNSQIELYDHDILAIESGPLAWANAQVGTARNLEDFANRLKDQFLKVGFFIYFEYGQPMECRCYPQHVALDQCPNLQFVQSDVFMPCITITGRVDGGQPFDYERMSWEVQNNILNIPGQEKGKIKFDEREFLKRHGKGHKH